MPIDMKRYYHMFRYNKYTIACDDMKDAGLHCKVCGTSALPPSAGTCDICYRWMEKHIGG